MICTDFSVIQLTRSLCSLLKIKEEPIDEEYKEYFSFSISAEDIKDEPKVAKEDLKIGSVFSFTEQNTSTVATETKMDFTASCSNCKNALVDGETVYQRKSHAEIFCSSPCLLNFYQMKQAKNTCHFCLQAITKPQGVLQAPVDTEETMKDFCSQACLSSFNYKRITSAKIHIKPVASRRHEIIHLDVVHKLCSDPCFLRFCNMNNLLVCVNCGSHCNTPVVLKMKDGSKKLCSAECLAQFRKKTQTQQPCAMCCTARLMTDMVENENSENEVELFCTTSCVMASKIQAVSASGLPLDCDHCGKTTVPACHLAMSDASIRNFCTLTCAMTFKVIQPTDTIVFKTLIYLIKMEIDDEHAFLRHTWSVYSFTPDTTSVNETLAHFLLFLPQETQNVDTNPPAASDQPQCDFHKPPEKLLCAQCRRILKTTPEVVQKKGKMNFVCSLACSEEFKRVNNIMGKCEYCKNERIIKDVKKVDNKDCYFCSDGCRMLYHHELKEKWGEYCHSCAYCLSISKTVVTAQYKGTEEEFCSEDCSANYKMLFCHVAKCDTCGHEGKLRQSLPILGEVKHFCDLKCLLHFCNKKVQMPLLTPLCLLPTVSSPSRPVGTVESSPVIANVISLAGALARQHRASASSAQQGTSSHTHTHTHTLCMHCRNAINYKKSLHMLRSVICFSDSNSVVPSQFLSLTFRRRLLDM
uniref:TRASH domain-containing protein n=1 Tax=Sparus aurata TaxID=8175 RepID=A0A671XI67_SPAAU